MQTYLTRLLQWHVFLIRQITPLGHLGRQTQVSDPNISRWTIDENVVTAKRKKIDATYTRNLSQIRYYRNNEIKWHDMKDTLHICLMYHYSFEHESEFTHHHPPLITTHHQLIINSSTQLNSPRPLYLSTSHTTYHLISRWMMLFSCRNSRPFKIWRHHRLTAFHRIMGFFLM